MGLELNMVTALDALRDSHGTATHWVAGWCGFGTDTAKARRLLRRMEARGLVSPIHASRSGRAFWWSITDEGRQALNEAENP